jgi:hypothetical protein
VKLTNSLGFENLSIQPWRRPNVGSMVFEVKTVSENSFLMEDLDRKVIWKRIVNFVWSVIFLTLKMMHWLVPQSLHLQLGKNLEKISHSRLTIIDFLSIKIEKIDYYWFPFDQNWILFFKKFEAENSKTKVTHESDEIKITSLPFDTSLLCLLMSTKDNCSQAGLNSADITWTSTQKLRFKHPFVKLFFLKVLFWTNWMIYFVIYPTHKPEFCSSDCVFWRTNWQRNFDCLTDSKTG